MAKLDKYITKVCSEFQENIAMRFTGIPIKIDMSLEGNQYYISVSQELYNQIEEERTKDKVRKEKCYPVPTGNVSICNNNKDGQCILFNKKCDNIQEKHYGKTR